MPGPKQRELAPAVEAVRQRIEEWRNTRAKRTRMPEELWEDAASLVPEYGLWSISQSLRVNYEGLKGRSGPGEGQRRSPRKAARRTGFVELGAAQVGGPGEPSGPVLELSRPDGARLTIRLRAGDGLDLSALAGAFWEGGR